MLSVDVSYSMLARDLEPDRITALKNIAIKFIEKRPADRIGLVTYAGEAFTKVPVTSDHAVVIDELKNLNQLELPQGTAIGEGLSVAVSHLRHSKAKSKIIILMTDGVNTIENALPAQVGAQLAKSNDIKVYTVGIGTNGFALMPTATDIFGDLVFSETEVLIDEPFLAFAYPEFDLLLEDVCKIKGVEQCRPGQTCVVPADYVFVLGDNRSSSVDSRALGLFHKSQIIGVVKYKRMGWLDWRKV